MPIATSNTIVELDTQDLDDGKNTEEVALEYLNRVKTGLEGIARREAVNHPPHYNQGNIEVIDAIEDWGLDFNAGNVVKYVSRHQHKAEPLEDLKKARWYLDRIIEGFENGSIKD
tara:strand:+ start:19652 stop:19996 length:345 start_codon:yes stop_codon:yes gene_type:complete